MMRRNYICYQSIYLKINIIMKAFRSSKNLRVVDCKQDNPLRNKIKLLEQQIQMLQKSNLNIFIPISQQQPKNTPNYEAIIAKLKTQILNLQQDNHQLKNNVKKLENQKEMLKINMQNQINELHEQIIDLKNEKQQLKEQLQNLDEKLLLEGQKRREMQKELIEMRVENKFLKDDINNLKRKITSIQAKYEQLQLNVAAVQYNSKIYHSRQTRVTAIETQQLKKLKLYIEDLQKQIKQLLNSKMQKVYVGGKSKNIGEEIVRLKTNIDMQLGLKVTNQTTASFMQAYNDAQTTFDQLISACKPN